MFVRKKLFILIQLLIYCITLSNAFAYEFRSFGTMIPEVGPGRPMHGPDATGEIDTLYMMFNSVNGWFMVTVDTKTGDYKQYNAPGRDIYVTSHCVGPDGRIYIRTAGDRGILPHMGGLYVFDPASAEKGIKSLGIPCEGEGYLFGLTGAPDGRLYMGSYGTGRLLVYDLDSREFRDYGNIVEQEKDTSSVAPFSEKFAYVGVGVTRNFIVRVNLETGMQKDVVFPLGHEKDEAISVYLGKDARVYCRLKSTNLPCVIEGLQMRLLKKGERAGEKYGLQTIAGGTFKYDWDAREVVFNKNDRSRKTFKYDYTGAAAHLFMVRKGPGSLILGLSDLPLRIFKFDLTTHTHQNLGNPMPLANGDVYSILPYDDEKVYIGAYPRADLIVYDPTNPWKTIDGKASRKNTNPLALGQLENGQNRPYDMLVGPDNFVYIATTATYGQVGGAITKLDPNSNSWKVYRYPVGNHAIASLSKITGSRNMIAGGTMGFATGYDLDSFGEGKLFLWDINQDKVIYKASPPLEKAQYILQLESTDDGILIGACGKNYNQISLFAFDPTSRKFIYHKNITEEVAGYIWEANPFSEPYKGKIYFTTNNRIFTIDCKSFELEVLAEYEGETRGTVLTRDGGANGRMACSFITESTLVALYLEP